MLTIRQLEDGYYDIRVTVGNDNKMSFGGVFKPVESDAKPLQGGFSLTAKLAIEESTK